MRLLRMTMMMNREKFCGLNGKVLNFSAEVELFTLLYFSSNHSLLIFLPNMKHLN